MRVSSTPHSTAPSGLAVSAMTRPPGSETPLSLSHLSALAALVMVSIVVKVLLATAISVLAGSHFAKAASSATPSMFETTWTSQ